MVYIPEDLLVNKNNMDKAHDLISLLDVDFMEDGKDKKDQVVKELKKLGETTIIDKLNEGFFSLGA